MSKVIRLNDAVLNKINEFIEVDRNLDEVIYNRLHGSLDGFVYSNVIAFGDDTNDWINYIISYAIACQKNKLKEWEDI